MADGERGLHSTNQPDITRTLPPGEPKRLDPGVFGELLRDATKAYVRIISRSEPVAFPREIVRPKIDGFESVDIRFPYYGHWNWERVKAEPASPGLKELLDYLWAQNSVRTAFVGPDPQREAWEASALAEIVHVAVARALDDAAVDEAIDTGAVTDWRLPESSLEAHVEEQIDMWCREEHCYVAECPMGYLKMDPGASWSLGNGIELSNYTRREAAGYLTRSRLGIWGHDLHAMYLFDQLNVLKVRGTYHPSPRKATNPKTLEEMVEEEIANRIDVVKWALMTVLGHGAPLKEGLITYDLLAIYVPSPAPNEVDP